MHLLDMKTVLFSFFVTNLIVTLILVRLWLQNRHRFAGLHLWAASLACQTAGMPALMLRGVAPDVISVLLGNTVVIVGIICLQAGLGKFLDRKTRMAPNILILAGALLLLVYYNYRQPDTAARVVVFSFASLLIFVQAAWLSWRQALGELKRSARWVGVVLALFGAVQIYRIAITVANPPAGGFLQASNLEVAGIIGNQMLTIVLVFL